jgi:polysaccharide biosynthesis/export protein
MTRLILKRVLWIAMLVAASGSGICAQTPRLQQPYQIQPNDVLEVRFPLTPEFNQTVTVDTSGQIYLPELGPIRASGMNIEQFRSEVVAAASKRLVNPQVSVNLKDFDKPHFFVEGEVTSPGRFEYRPDISALDAVALAGGFKVSARKSKVFLVRKVDGNASETRILNLKELIDHGKLQEAALLQPGDIIFVTQDSLSKIERLTRLGTFGAIYNPLQ